MSKSAPATPPRVFKEPDLFEPRSKVHFDKMVSVYLINNPPYPAEKYPWEDDNLHEFNKKIFDQENIDSDTESDTQEPASPKSAFSFLPCNSASISADYDEQKEISDEEEGAESYYNSESVEEGDESDYEGDYVSDEGDEYSEPESGLEDDYQEPKRLKVIKLPPAPFPDYTSLTSDFEIFCKKQELQTSSIVKIDISEDKLEKPAISTKRKQPEESQYHDCRIETYQPNLKNFKLEMHNLPKNKPFAIFPDYAPLIEVYQASLEKSSAHIQLAAIPVENVPNDNQGDFDFLGKRSRSIFEESKYAARISSKLKNKNIHAFFEGRENLESALYSSYDEEQELVSFSKPLSLKISHSPSSSASASSSDCHSAELPDNPPSSLPPLLGSSSYSEQYSDSDDELSPEEIAAQRESGIAPRGEWEDELCSYLAATGISADESQVIGGEAMHHAADLG